MKNTRQHKGFALAIFSFQGHFMGSSESSCKSITVVWKCIQSAWQQRKRALRQHFSKRQLLTQQSVVCYIEGCWAGHAFILETSGKSSHLPEREDQAQLTHWQITPAISPDTETSAAPHTDLHNCLQSFEGLVKHVCFGFDRLLSQTDRGTPKANYLPSCSSVCLVSHCASEA